MNILINTTKNTLLIILLASFLMVSNYASWNNIAASSFIDNNNTDFTQLPMAFLSESSNQSMWREIGRHLNLDHKTQTPAVKKAIKRLLADKDSLYIKLQDATPYLYYIYQRTKAKGLPAELALIPFVESEYNPNDHSIKGATGLWQLMVPTARELGVKVKSGYDGRRNVIASTNAALAYFNDLGHMFHGDWYLAIAAYNAGQGRVINAEHKVGSKNYWQLPLPQETQLYVPKLLAIAAIIKNPSYYHFKLPVIKNHAFFSILQSTKGISLQNIAKYAHIDLGVLKKLNPDYTHQIIPNLKNYSYLIPRSRVSAVLHSINGMSLMK